MSRGQNIKVSLKYSPKLEPLRSETQYIFSGLYGAVMTFRRAGGTTTQHDSGEHCSRHRIASERPLMMENIMHQQHRKRHATYQTPQRNPKVTFLIIYKHKALQLYLIIFVRCVKAEVREQIPSVIKTTHRKWRSLPKYGKQHRTQKWLEFKHSWD